MSLLKFIPGNKFTTDVVWSGLSFFTLSVCGIIINVVITGYYGAGGTGIFNQSVALYLIGGTIASFGLNTSMVKYAADSSGDSKSLSYCLGSAIIPALFFSVALMLLLYVAVIFFPAAFVNAEVGRAFSILIPAIPFFALSKVLSGFLNGLRRMKIFSVLQTMRWLIILTAVVIMAMSGSGLNTCLLSFVAAEIVTTILLFFISFRISGYRLRWSSAKAKEHISFGSKSLITGFIADLNDRLDVLLAGMLISNQAAGVYSFAASIARGLPALGSVVQLNFSPVVSELWSVKNIAVLKKRMSQVFYYNLMIFIPLTLLAPAAYHIFLKFFVHDSHILSGEMIFLILAAGMGSGSIFYFLGSFLSMCGMPKQQLGITFWLCIFNVSATTMLTIIFGIIGTAAGTAAGFIFLILLLQWYISRHTGINMFKTLLGAKSYAAKKKEMTAASANIHAPSEKGCYLFFIVHPSKFLLYRHCIETLKKQGHTVEIAIAGKDVLESLVKESGWEYHNLFPKGRRPSGNGRIRIWISMTWYFFLTLWRLYRLTSGKRYTMFEGDCLTIIGRIRKVPSVLFIDDDFSITPANRVLYKPATAIISPSVTDLGPFNHKKIGLNTYKELAWLHPAVFKPDISIAAKANPGMEPYAFLRLVSLTASHDAGKKGLSNAQLEILIHLLEEKYRVFISSERKLPEHLKRYIPDLAPYEMTHLLSFADLYIGDSQTMTSEACLLGVPSLRINDFAGKISVMEEKESRFDLCYSYKTSEFESLLERLHQLMTTERLREIWAEKRKKMLNEIQNPSEFLTDFFLHPYDYIKKK